MIHRRTAIVALAALADTGAPAIVPSIGEAAFPGFEASVWYGFIGPAGMPAALVAQYHAAIQKAIATRRSRTSWSAPAAKYCRDRRRGWLS